MILQTDSSGSTRAPGKGALFTSVANVVTTVSVRRRPCIAGSGDFGRALAIEWAAGRTGFFGTRDLQSADEVHSSGPESAVHETVNKGGLRYVSRS